MKYTHILMIAPSMWYQLKAKHRNQNALRMAIIGYTFVSTFITISALDTFDTFGTTLGPGK